MSQLDVSISFSQLIGLLLVFYIFMYFLIGINIRYVYNKKLRLLSDENFVNESLKSDKSLILKKILKI